MVLLTIMEWIMVGALLMCLHPLVAQHWLVPMSGMIVALRLLLRMYARITPRVIYHVLDMDPPHHPARWDHDLPFLQDMIVTVYLDIVVHDVWLMMVERRIIHDDQVDQVRTRTSLLSRLHVGLTVLEILLTRAADKWRAMLLLLHLCSAAVNNQPDA